MSLRIQQYAYFAVHSTSVSATQMGLRIGCAPDRTTIRASRSAEPPVPRSHRWLVDSPDRTLRLDEQIAALITRLSPHREAIGALVDELRAAGGEAGASLVLVRYLHDRDGVLDGFQHRLLGWHLDAEAVSFLAAARAVVDVDEYGRDLPWSRDLLGGVEAAQRVGRGVVVGAVGRFGRLRQVLRPKR